MNFVIGDIHGEITKLRGLISILEKFEINKLYFIGDYINKGENSKNTLEYLCNLSELYNCFFLLGNHEYAWMKFIEEGGYRDYLMNYGGKSTLKDFNIKELEPSIVKQKILTPFKDFFNQLKPYIILERFFISHSGPKVKNLKNGLDNVKPKELLFQRYDFIKNNKPYNNKIMIFGHTGFYYPFYDGKKIGIDTGAAYLKNAPLTAFELDNEFFINNLNQKTILDEYNLNSCPAIIRGNPYRIL